MVLHKEVTMLQRYRPDVTHLLWVGIRAVGPGIRIVGVGIRMMDIHREAAG